MRPRQAPRTPPRPARPRGQTLGLARAWTSPVPTRTDYSTACPCPSCLSASLVPFTAMTLKPTGAGAAGPEAGWTPGASETTRRLSRSPGCGPGGCRLFTGTSNGLLTSTLRGLGPAPTGLVSRHPDMRPLMTRFPPDRPHSPLFPLQPPKQGFGPGLGPQLPRSHRRLEVQRGAWGRSAPPHPSRWKAPSGPAGGSTESRGHQPGTNPAWKP